MAPMTSFLCKNIANPPCTIDAPGLLRVVVKQRIRAHLIDKRFAIRLDIPLFVCRATHDLCGFAVPYPVHLKPGLRFRQHGMVQLRLFPGFGAVGADLDLRDLAMAAPGQTRDAIISGRISIVPEGCVMTEFVSIRSWNCMALPFARSCV